MIKTFTATARGISHHRDGRPNQDAMRVVALDHETHVMAVADGHGSSVHGDIGARLAVEIATLRLTELWRGQREERRPLDACASLLLSQVFGSIIGAWRRAVEACLAIEPGRSRVDAGVLKPFGATLLMALVRPEGAVVAQLGDGGIWHFDGQDFRQAVVDDVEAGIGETTWSLCSPQAEQHAVVRLWPRVGTGAATLVLATDGFEKSYPKRGDEGGFLAGVHQQLGGPGADGLGGRLQKWVEQMATQGAGDDTTMAVVYWPDVTPVAEVVPAVAEVTVPATLDEADGAAETDVPELASEAADEPDVATATMGHAVPHEAAAAHDDPFASVSDDDDGPVRRADDQADTNDDLQTSPTLLRAFVGPSLHLPQVDSAVHDPGTHD